MWLILCSILSLVFLAITNGHIDSLKRQKRYLIFTPATQWGVFTTISIPLHPEATVSVAWFFEANYFTVDNTSYYDPLIDEAPVVRNFRSIQDEPTGLFTRSYLYAFIESMLQKHGYPGRWCLLRAICENAHTSSLHSGVLGDLLHVVLTPSTSMSEDEIEDFYYEAEYYGLEEQCREYYENCISSPLDFISVFIENIK